MVDEAALRMAGALILRAIGEDPERDGLRDTPDRFARAWAEFADYDPGNIGTAFLERADEMVVVSGVVVWSMCEHHLLPFRARIAMGYVPADAVLGLSKFARIAHGAAHRLQLQERLVMEIAEDIAEATGSPNVAVVADGEHTCMTMRGVRSPATMRTSVMQGIFRDKSEARAEFLSLVNGGHRAAFG